MVTNVELVESKEDLPWSNLDYLVDIMIFMIFIILCVQCAQERSARLDEAAKGKECHGTKRKSNE